MEVYQCHFCGHGFREPDIEYRNSAFGGDYVAECPECHSEEFYDLDVVCWSCQVGDPETFVPVGKFTDMDNYDGPFTFDCCEGHLLWSVECSDSGIFEILQ